MRKPAMRIHSRHGMTAVALVMLLIPGRVAAQETILYYTTDAIGSVRMVTDSGGAVVARYDYRPFGDPCGTACGPQGSTEKRQFSGGEKDAETSLDYFAARHYASGFGRFTTVDPDHIGASLLDPQSWNAYAYARNNPLSFVDPTGTDYTVDVIGGAHSVWVSGGFSSLTGALSGFSTSGNMFGGLIKDAQGKIVGSYEYRSPFDSMLFSAGRIATPGADLAVAGLTTIAAFAFPVATAGVACVADAVGGEGCSASGVAMAVVPAGPLVRGTFGWVRGGPWREAVRVVKAGGTIENIAGKVPSKAEALRLIEEAGYVATRIEDVGHSAPNPHSYPHVNYSSITGKRVGTIRFTP